MNKSIVAALAVSGLLVVWMASGVGQSAPSESNLPDPQLENKVKKNALMQVQYMPLHAQQIDRLVVVQGQVEPFRTLELKAEVDGKVTALNVEQGQRVKAGTTIVTQDLKFRQAQKQQADAQVKYRQNLLKASKKLHKQGLVSDSRLSEDKSELAKAKAALAQIEYEIANINLRAPFAGVINERLVELGDSLAPGQKVATLVDDATLKITAMVPQHQLDAIALGQNVDVELSNGESVTGQVSYISATADVDTRSYKIEVHVDNSAGHRWIGMSATLSVAVAKVAGHWVKTSVIGLNTDGQLQVKAIDKDSKVVIYPIDIIRTEADGIWISGLPSEVNLITLGQDFVIAGQQVVGQNSDKSTQS